MGSFLNNSNRRMIPRWRTYDAARRQKELGSAHSADAVKRQIDSSYVEERLIDWQKNPSISFAADLVSSAYMARLNKLAIPAAEFLLGHQKGVAQSTIEIAKSILNIPIDEAEDEHAEIRSRIRGLKTRVRVDPRDSISWVDLAREYTTLGQNEQAERSIRAALAISPDNRFILRSSSRFFVHIKQTDEAHHILNKSNLVRRDPWILAAEIATSSILGKKSKHLKLAKRLVENDSLSSFQFSELAASIATVEFEEGNTNAAKKLFKKTSINPTENAVAQIEWARNLLRNLPVESRLYEIARTYEARAWRSFFDGDWNKALVHAMKWLRDEPFSVRPIVHASYIEAVINEKHQRAIEILNRALRVNSRDATLRNNIAFSLASLNKLEEAESQFDSIDINSVEDGDVICIAATHGLIEFRKGHLEAGREFYNKAIAFAEKRKLYDFSAFASINLAREELTASSAFSKEAFNRAKKYAERSKDRKDVSLLLKRLEALRMQNKMF